MFWNLIEGSRARARSRQDRSRGLLEAVKRLPAAEILDFEVFKDQAVRRLDTFDLLAAHSVIVGGGSAGGDGYFYFLHWVIGLGRSRCQRVLADPDVLAGFSELPRPIGACERWPDEGWPEWEDLLSLAARAHAEVAGLEFGGPGDVRGLAGSLSDPQTRGREWDIFDDAEVARRLPKLWKRRSRELGRART